MHRNMDMPKLHERRHQSKQTYWKVHHTGMLRSNNTDNNKGVRKKKEKENGDIGDGQKANTRRNHTTFWTDGSGIKIKGTEGLMKTGWATVRCEVTKKECNKTPVTIKKVETWRGGGLVGEPED